MKNIFLILQIIFGVLMAVLILLQSKGTGMGSTFGGDMGFYGTKRGAEKILFMATIVFAALFLLASLGGVLAP